MHRDNPAGDNVIFIKGHNEWGFWKEENTMDRKSNVASNAKKKWFP
jgi:hypothetical protein